MNRADRARTEYCRGFTLIEVVVAFAILGIGLVILMELFSGGLRLARTSQEYTMAMDFGRARMEEIALKPSVEEGSEEGNFDEFYRWQAEVKKIILLPMKKDDPNFNPPVQLYKIQLDIFWKSGSKERSVRLETCKSLKPEKDEKKI